MASSRSESENTIATLRRTTDGSHAGARKAGRLPSRSSTLEATKTPPIEIRLRGDVPHKVMEEIQIRYGAWILGETAVDDSIDLSLTEEWKGFSSRQTSGTWISGLRSAHGWTQKELGKRLGGVSTARVSDWEHGRRAVSKSFAKSLAGLFGVSADRFLV
jgi:hypothetical protein